MRSFQAERDDSTTERVLRALDAVQPAAGFEDRVLQRLAQQSQQPEQPARRFGLSVRGLLAGAGCVVAVLIVLLSVHLWSKRSTSPLRRETVADLSSSRSPLVPAPALSPAVVTSEAKPAPQAPHSAYRMLVVHAARHEAASAPGPAIDGDIHEVATARDLDRQALDDLHAASSPPPPLQSTAQERMVRLMLRRGEKHDLAQLDSAQSVRLTDAEQRSFKTFFDPDPSPELALELKKGNLR